MESAIDVFRWLVVVLAAGALILTLAIAGCSQWDGAAVIHLHGQPSLSCPGGLWMTRDGITCYDKPQTRGISVPWTLVRGYEAR